jgi:hypothetical protein
VLGLGARFRFRAAGPLAMPGVCPAQRTGLRARRQARAALAAMRGMVVCQGLSWWGHSLRADRKRPHHSPSQICRVASIVSRRARLTFWDLGPFPMAGVTVHIRQASRRSAVDEAQGSWADSFPIGRGPKSEESAGPAASLSGRRSSSDTRPRVRPLPAAGAGKRPAPATVPPSRPGTPHLSPGRAWHGQALRPSHTARPPGRPSRLIVAFHQ